MRVVPKLEVSDADIGDMLRQIANLFDHMPAKIRVQGGEIARSEHLKTHLEMATESCQRIASTAFRLGLEYATTQPTERK